MVYVFRQIGIIFAFGQPRYERNHFSQAKSPEMARI